MKKAFYRLMVFVMFALPACDKDKEEKSDPGTRDLQGGWALVVPFTTTFPTTATDTMLSFAGNKYYIYKFGVKLKEGTYTTMLDTTVEQHVCRTGLSDQFNRRIVFDNDSSAPKIFFFIEKHLLTTVSGCDAAAPGYIQQYVRVLPL